MKRKRTATLRIMAVMASAMLGSSFYIFTTYAATIRHGVAAAVHAENGFGPGYVTVSEEAQTSAASGDTTSTYAVNDHKTVNANAASESSIDNVASLSTTDTINDAYKTVVMTTSEIGNDKTVTDFDGSYDYTTPVKSDDEAWADLQKAPAGGGNKGGWGNSYSGANSIPLGNIDEATMHTYSGYSRSSDTTSKVIYLTFDEGYENGYTPTFLDVLKKHGIHGTFFVTGSYLKSQPDLVKRMVAEGHIVGNHTLKHPSMSTITTHEAFWNQLKSNSDLFYQTTGYQMPRFYRPPEGSVSTAQLQEAQAMGYRTILWSVAHLDWNVKKQPSRETALATLNRRIHPGAIVLLHCVSSTNASILDELLTGWEQQGYTFSTLDKIS